MILNLAALCHIEHKNHSKSSVTNNVKDQSHLGPEPSEVDLHELHHSV